jgi:hypothetical protein
LIVESKVKHSVLAQNERFSGQGRMPSASFDLKKNLLNQGASRVRFAGCAALDASKVTATTDQDTHGFAQDTWFRCPTFAKVSTPNRREPDNSSGREGGSEIVPGHNWITASSPGASIKFDLDPRANVFRGQDTWDVWPWLNFQK